MGRIDGGYTAVYALCTRLKTAAYTGRVHGPCRRPCNGRLHVYTCTLVVYTIRRPCTRHVHGRKYTAVTARLRPCIRPCTLIYVYMGSRDGRYTYRYIRVHGAYTAVYAPCTRPLHGRVHGPCARLVTRPIHGRVHGRLHLYTCTWAVDTAFTRPCT